MKGSPQGPNQVHQGQVGMAASQSKILMQMVRQGPEGGGSVRPGSQLIGAADKGEGPAVSLRPVEAMSGGAGDDGVVTGLRIVEDSVAWPGRA
jgi:hypothetical protein